MSDFSEFLTTTTASTEVTDQALLDWIKRYGIVLWRVSDQGVYLKTESMRRFHKPKGANHHSVTA